MEKINQWTVTGIRKRLIATDRRIGPDKSSLFEGRNGPVTNTGPKLCCEQVAFLLAQIEKLEKQTRLLKKKGKR